MSRHEWVNTLHRKDGEGLYSLTHRGVWGSPAEDLGDHSAGNPAYSIKHRLLLFHTDTSIKLLVCISWRHIGGSPWNIDHIFVCIYLHDSITLYVITTAACAMATTVSLWQCVNCCQSLSLLGVFHSTGSAVMLLLLQWPILALGLCTSIQSHNFHLQLDIWIKQWSSTFLFDQVDFKSVICPCQSSAGIRHTVSSFVAAEQDADKCNTYIPVSVVNSFV